MKNQKTFRAYIRKEAIKFSAAHMTVFPNGKKESLHGHNYRPEVSVDLKDISFQSMVPFVEFKKVMKEISRLWDEKVLLAEECPFLQIVKRDKKEVEIRLCGKRYVFPADEVVFLPVDNITTETLASAYLDLLIVGMKKVIRAKGSPVARIEVRIDEISGQGASASYQV